MTRLVRHSAIVVLVTIVLVTVTLGLFYRHVTKRSLISAEQQASQVLTKSYASSMWPGHSSFVSQASSIGREELRRAEELRQIRRDFRLLLRGLGSLSVTLLDMHGLVIYAADPERIGETGVASDGFRAARAGKTQSTLAFYEVYRSDRGEFADRYVVTTYVPVRILDAAPVEAVLAIDADVTALMSAMGSQQMRTIGWLALLMSLVFILVLRLTSRADRLLHEQQLHREKDAERMRYQAYHDALTDLPNRISFTEHVEEAVRRAKRAGWTLGVMFLDLDRFKIVNDSLGHDAGDKLLVLAAQRIRSALRECDLLFRMGGDEFTVILEDVKIPEQASTVAQRVLDALGEPIRLMDEEFTISASIGIAVYPRDGDCAERLVKSADTAMYRAKELGRGRSTFFTPEMNEKVETQLKMETALQRAVANNEFLLHYQPRVCAATQKVVGLEALLRWAHPEWGLVPPNRFIPHLEESGLIVAVGAWVIREACRQNKAWQDAGLPAMRVSVNLSSRQFRSDSLVSTVRSALAESGLEPCYLELELTETLLVDNTEHAIELMHGLKALGIAMSIDDFGTGYSSLSYLKRFPIDCLKIDRSFVADLATSSKDAAIVQAIAALARSLGIGLVAEGVEDANQARLLCSQECTELQGYYFSRPVGSDRVIDAIVQLNSCADKLAA